MRFEFDPEKSAANREKHGIDFVEAQGIFDDDRMYVADLAYPGEPRFVAVGLVRGKLWAAICTRRGAAVRLISVRRAREGERDVYGQDRLSDG